MGDMREKMQWQISVPIFRNTVFLQQLGIAFGIPFGLAALGIALSPGQSLHKLYGLGLMSLLLLCAWLFIMAVYGGKYEAEFILDERGALCRTQAKQAKKNRVVNTLTVALGLFSGKPAAAGAGMLAQSRQAVLLKWNRVRKVTYKPRSFTILLRGGFAEQVALFCTGENYPAVERFVLRETAEPHNERQSRRL